MSEWMKECVSWMGKRTSEVDFPPIWPFVVVFLPSASVWHLCLSELNSSCGRFWGFWGTFHRFFVPKAPLQLFHLFGSNFTSAKNEWQQHLTASKKAKIYSRTRKLWKQRRQLFRPRHFRLRWRLVGTSATSCVRWDHRQRHHPFHSPFTECKLSLTHTLSLCVSFPTNLLSRYSQEEREMREEDAGGGGRL